MRPWRRTSAFKAVKPNVNEQEISALMQYEWTKRGCERPSYAPIVGSGLNSTVLHYAENDNVMHAGDVVVIDAAGEYSMYAADITRTLPVNGHFTARQREIYEIVLGAQEAAMAAFQSGKSMLVGSSDTSIEKVAMDYINSRTARTCMVSRWENILSMAWVITSASKCTTTEIIKCRRRREWPSPSNPEFIFPKKRSACASKMITGSIPMGS